MLCRRPKPAADRSIAVEPVAVFLLLPPIGAKECFGVAGKIFGGTAVFGFATVAAAVRMTGVFPQRAEMAVLHQFAYLVGFCVVVEQDIADAGTVGIAVVVAVNGLPGAVGRDNADHGLGAQAPGLLMVGYSGAAEKAATAAPASRSAAMWRLSAEVRFCNCLATAVPRANAAACIAGSSAVRAESSSCSMLFQMPPAE